MNLFRLLIIAAVVVIGYRLISTALARRRIERERQAASAATQGEPLEAGETVRCAHCGLNLPKAEALCLDGRPYCSPQHRDEGTE